MTRNKKMNSKTIEQLAVSAVKDSITVCDRLEPYISENDKKPSWDGEIIVYNSDNRTKNNIKGVIPVQVKGSEQDNLSRDEISFPVCIADLSNFLNDGGTIFFVVYVLHGGLAKQIYYISLPPIKIRIILSEAKGEKTHNVKLKKFPSELNLRQMICLNCLEDCKKQASFSDSPLLSIEDLKRRSDLESISMSVTAVGVDSTTAFLTNEVYLYANFKGCSIPQPLGLIPGKMIAEKEIDARITVGSRQFYNSVRFYKDGKQTVTTIGESFTIIYKDDQTIQMTYSDSSKIRTFVRDMEFILAFIKEGYFGYNDVSFPLDKTDFDISKFSVEKAQNRLDDAKKIVKMLDILNCNKDIDFMKLNEQDWKNINILTTAFVDKKKVPNLKKNLSPIQYIRIGNIKFIIVLKEGKTNKATYAISDFFNTNLILSYKNRNGDDVWLSQYALLKTEDFLTVDNIRFDKFLTSFQKVEQHLETIEKANFFMLDLISAYDKDNSRIEILNTAKAFSDWIMQASDEEIPYNIRLINKLQITRRLKGLSDVEKQNLLDIADNSESSDAERAGAYLLLDQRFMADRYLSKLSEQEQEGIRKSPIYHFYAITGLKNKLCKRE